MFECEYFLIGSYITLILYLPVFFTDVLPKKAVLENKAKSSHMMAYPP